ncbi:MAG: insulinase family protein [Candidatus Aenigmarchaeota archaeon]|nr:insulinase family protein [Candidatus Aenigmarchaeota archaeon]
MDFFQGNGAYQLSDVYFGRYTDTDEDPIKGKKATWGNGLAAYHLHVPTATDITFGVVFNFGSLNEGRLPVETAHAWEHAAFSDQQMLKLARKYHARTPHDEGSIWTELHRIIGRVNCSSQWSLFPALESLCRSVYGITDEKLASFEQERIPMEIESRAHRNNADEFFPYSVLAPAVFHDTSLKGRIAYARHYGHYRSGLQTSHVTAYHHANFSPDKIVVVVTSPNEDDDTTKTFKVVDRALGKLEMRPTRDRTLSVSTRAQTQKLTVDKRYDAPRVGMGCRIPNTLDVVAAVDILDSMLADDGAKRYLEVARSQTGGYPKFSYHVYSNRMTTGTGTDAYLVFGPTLPGRHNELRDAIFEAWDIGGLVRYKEIFRSGKERALARHNENLQTGSQVFLMASDLHFDPRDVNNPDSYREKVEGLTFEEVLDVQQRYISGENCAAIAVARPIRKGTIRVTHQPSRPQLRLAAR